MTGTAQRQWQERALTKTSKRFFLSDSNDTSNYGRMFNGDHRVNKGAQVIRESGGDAVKRGEGVCRRYGYFVCRCC